MRNIYVTILAIFGFIQFGNAQDSYWSANWDISMATGETKEFIENVNFRGFSVEGRFFVKSNFSIGGFLAWDNMYDKQYDLPPIEIEVEDRVGHISGTQLHYLNMVPLMATGHYYIDTKSDMKIYLGTGIGGVYVEQRTDLGLRSDYSDSFGFGVQPEIGTYIPVGYGGSGINFSVRYLYAPSAVEFDTLSTLTFAIGFGFMN